MNLYTGILLLGFAIGVVFGSIDSLDSASPLPKFEYVTDKPLEVNSNYIAYIESRYNSRAVSPEGALGYMQVMPAVLEDWNSNHPSQRYTESQMFDKHINLRIGTWYLNTQIPLFLKSAHVPNKVSYRLIAYNWGIGNFLRWYKRGENYKKLPLETQNYLLTYWKNY